MRLVRFQYKDMISYGTIDNYKIIKLDGDIYDGFSPTKQSFSINEVKHLAPCEPTKIIAVGLNYLDHIKESNEKTPASPIIFMKPPSSCIGPKDIIMLPQNSKRIDYEAELGIVIKKKAKNVPVSEASDYILGYTCLNDVSARDFQKNDGQWTRAKGFDTFCPIGPVITDEIDPFNTTIKAILNDELKQNSSTSNLIFNVFELISFISHIMTLLPGDIIATGTPSGVGPLKPGDCIKIHIEGIGTLTNYVKSI